MSIEDTEGESLESMTAIQLSDVLISQKELYCVSCFEFLWPPVMWCEEGNVCGNCWDADSDRFIRNTVLEKILEKLSIQCMNFANGCKVRSNYKEMAEHNKKCTYRRLCCPIDSIDCCSWLGYNKELIDHFIREHPQETIKSENNSVLLNFDIQKDVKQIKLIVLPGKNFLSLTNTDTINQTLSITVFFIDGDSKSKATEYQFIVQRSTFDNDSVSYETNKFDIVNINNYKEYYNDGLKIDIAPLKKFSIGGFYSCTLKIMSALCENKTNEELLQNFECPVCRNYMKNQIYQCLAGHSMCGDCRFKVADCPSCRSGFGDTRNYALENISNSIYFPCSYLDRGCEEIFLGEDTIKHEGDCRFRPYVCPFWRTYCNWTGSLTELSEHLKEFHMDSTYIINKKMSITPFSLKRQFYQDYCLMTNCEIFSVSYKRDYKSQYAYWAIQLVGPNSESKSYTCEITLIDDRNPYKKLRILDFCQQFTNNEPNFHNSIKLPLGILSEFSNNGKLYYIVKILKIEK